MLQVLPLVPNVAGVTLAAAAVVAGAPLFSNGLRALRLQRALARVRAVSLDERPEGFVHVHGRVALESPLFAPLSGQRCAGYRLEAFGVDVPMARHVQEMRPLRLVDRGVTAHVNAQIGSWRMEKTDEREIAPTDRLTERLEDLLNRMPEAAWVRQSGRRLRLVERALLSGAECHVVGEASRARQAEWHHETEWLRSGTDGGPIAVSTLVAETTATPDIWIGPHADFLHVSDSPPTAEDLRVRRRDLIGVLAGPMLGLLGLFYLSSAADYWRATRGF